MKAAHEEDMAGTRVCSPSVLARQTETSLRDGLTLFGSVCLFVVTSPALLPESALLAQHLCERAAVGKVAQFIDVNCNGTCEFKCKIVALEERVYFAGDNMTRRFMQSEN